MKYKEFVERYCSDLLEFQVTIGIDADNIDEGFYYEDIVPDEEGNMKKVIYTKGNVPIPIIDILSLYPSEFEKEHPGQMEAYTAYMDMFEVRSGIDAIIAIRDRSRKEMDRVKVQADIAFDTFFDD